MTARVQRFTKRKHGWNKLDDYIRIHHRVLTTPKFAPYFTNSPSYADRWYNPQYLWLYAEFRFQKGILLEVEKHVEVQDAPKGKGQIARTESYSYNVADAMGCLFRYCPPHSGHNQFDHRHTYDCRTRAKVVPVDRLQKDEVPYVSDVIAEIIDFMQDPNWP